MTTLHPKLHTILSDLRCGRLSDSEAAQKLIDLNRAFTPRWTWAGFIEWVVGLIVGGAT